MNLVPVVSRRRVPGNNDSDHTFLDRHGFTDFELRFVRAPGNRLPGSILHLFIVPQQRGSSPGTSMWLHGHDPCFDPRSAMNSCKCLTLI
jgi:hypothetical protein